MPYLEELWRCVRRGPAECVEVLVDGPDVRGEAEVAHLHHVRGHEEHVLGLQVAVEEQATVLHKEK